MLYAVKHAKIKAMKIENAPSLSKFLATAGVCSRRDAVQMIHDGQVTVNDKIVRNPAHILAPEDNVRARDKAVAWQERVYILLSKPKGYITTVSDDQGRETVMHLLKSRFSQRLYPVGRLDRSTTGALLMTNDGALAHRLLHPSCEIQKTYIAELDRPLDSFDRQKLLKGIMLEDGRAAADKIWHERHAPKKVVFLNIHNGKFRIVRRMFKALGYTVRHLERDSFAGIAIKHLKPGMWRVLSKMEIESLRSL